VPGALHKNCRVSELPALVKAGCREAAGRFVQKINLLTNTTPALRATPPQLRRGFFRISHFMCKAGARSPPGLLLDIERDIDPHDFAGRLIRRDRKLAGLTVPKDNRIADREVT
jgi:hypothetical protein